MNTADGSILKARMGRKKGAAHGFHPFTLAPEVTDGESDTTRAEDKADLLELLLGQSGPHPHRF